MKDKYFRRIVAVILVTGMITSAALVGYTIYLRSQCSIISFISNEGE